MKLILLATTFILMPVSVWAKSSIAIVIEQNSQSAASQWEYVEELRAVAEEVGPRPVMTQQVPPHHQGQYTLVTLELSDAQKAHIQDYIQRQQQAAKGSPPTKSLKRRLGVALLQSAAIGMGLTLTPFFSAPEGLQVSGVLFGILSVRSICAHFFAPEG